MAATSWKPGLPGKIPGAVCQPSRSQRHLRSHSRPNLGQSRRQPLRQHNPEQSSLRSQNDFGPMSISSTTRRQEGLHPEHGRNLVGRVQQLLPLLQRRRQELISNAWQKPDPTPEATGKLSRDFERYWRWMEDDIASKCLSWLPVQQEIYYNAGDLEAKCGQFSYTGRVGWKNANCTQLQPRVCEYLEGKLCVALFAQPNFEAPLTTACDYVPLLKDTVENKIQSFLLLCKDCQLSLFNESNFKGNSMNFTETRNDLSESGNNFGLETSSLKIEPISSDSKASKNPFPTAPTWCGPPLPDNTPKYPLSETERMVARGLLTGSIIFCICVIVFITLVFLLMRDFSIERLLHMGEEWTIAISFALVLWKAMDIEDPVGCKWTAVALQFLFLSHFGFLLLEAVHTYCILTNVLLAGSLYPRPIYMSFAIIIPAVVTLITYAIAPQSYVAQWSCWVNYKSYILLGEVIPLVAAFFVTIIVSEAGGMGRRHPILWGANRNQRRAAEYNRVGMFLIAPLMTAIFFLGSYAIFLARMGFFGTVAICNICLGVVLFFIHLMGNPRANAYVRRKWRRLCRSNQD